MLDFTFEIVGILWVKYFENGSINKIISGSKNEEMNVNFHYFDRKFHFHGKN